MRPIIIWDFDGTIVSSGGLYEKVRKQLLCSTIPERVDLYKQRYKSEQDFIENVVEISNTDFNQQKKLYLAIVHDYIDQLLPDKYNFIPFFQTISDDYEHIVFSNALKRVVKSYLKHWNISSYFKVFSVEDQIYENIRKPDPVAYLKKNEGNIFAIVGDSSEDMELSEKLEHKVFVLLDKTINDIEETERNGRTIVKVPKDYNNPYLKDLFLRPKKSKFL